MVIWGATSNPGKLREFQLAAGDFEVRSLSLPAPPETGATFEETARNKALYYGAHVSDYLFADDSGLEVDALGGGARRALGAIRWTRRDRCNQQ